MGKPKRNNKIIKFLFVFLLVVLFPNGSYSIQKNEEIPEQVIVGGELLQLNIETSKLMVYLNRDDNLKLKNYDLLESIKGKVVEDIYNKKSINNIKKEDIIKLNLRMKSTDRVDVIVKRDGVLKKFILSKKELHHSFFTDKIPFSASLTFIDPTNNTFGAVAHNMNVNNQKEILSNRGNIYLCNLSQVKKSNKNDVGFMQGDLVFQSQGNLYNITDFGIKGKINGEEILKNKEIYEVGNIEDVKNGPAQLLIKDSVNSKKQSYNILITKANKQRKPETQGFEFEVVDKELIDNYGGIVQGMSGCPIIQNGKIIGALSHVICSDTTKGIGVYIKWMMED